MRRWKKRRCTLSQIFSEDRIMQVIKSNKTQFEYDIQALLKSFYPEWEPRMLAPDSEVRDRRDRKSVV